MQLHFGIFFFFFFFFHIIQFSFLRFWTWSAQPLTNEYQEYFQEV
jgi:hypothetical protein